MSPLRALLLLPAPQLLRRWKLLRHQPPTLQQAPVSCARAGWRLWRRGWPGAQHFRALWEPGGCGQRQSPLASADRRPLQIQQKLASRPRLHPVKEHIRMLRCRAEWKAKKDGKQAWARFLRAHLLPRSAGCTQQPRSSTPDIRPGAAQGRGAAQYSAGPPHQQRSVAMKAAAPAAALSGRPTLHPAPACEAISGVTAPEQGLQAQSNNMTFLISAALQLV